MQKVVIGEENKSTIFVKSNKAPGQDRFSVDFFKVGWPIVGEDVIAVVKSFFDIGTKKLKSITNLYLLT
jgi:hypothetical protein